MPNDLSTIVFFDCQKLFYVDFFAHYLSRVVALDPPMIGNVADCVVPFMLY